MRSLKLVAEELALGDVRSNPDLLGNEMAVTREIFERPKQRLGPGPVTGGEFVLHPLSGEREPQRPIPVPSNLRQSSGLP